MCRKKKSSLYSFLEGLHLIYVSEVERIKNDLSTTTNEKEKVKLSQELKEWTGG